MSLDASIVFENYCTENTYARGMGLQVFPVVQTPKGLSNDARCSEATGLKKKKEDPVTRKNKEIIG